LGYRLDMNFSRNIFYILATFWNLLQKSNDIEISFSLECGELGHFSTKHKCQIYKLKNSDKSPSQKNKGWV